MIEIPGYTILGQIGKGGMATVYRARQMLLDREVALKVMSSQLAQDHAYAQRFLQEARMLAALNHPNVVQVYDVGVTPDGLNYFSMSLLPGGDFAQRMRDGISETELLRVLVAVATALGFAHARGYVHRDVTPANVLFDAHDTPVLTDFGIARALTTASRLTGSGMSIGTSHYMSPEQARGGEIDHRSDIYALGVLCYEAIVGETPFKGEDSFAVAFAHVHDPVPSLPEEVARWQPLIDKAMAKDPDDRYQHCAEFIEALQSVAPDEFRTLRPTAAPPPPRITQTGRHRFGLRALRRLPVWAWGLAAAIVLGAGLAWMLAGNLRESAPPKPTPPPVTTRTEPARTPPPTAVPEDAEDAAPDPIEEAPVAVDAGDDPDAAAALQAAMAHTVVDPVATLISYGRLNLSNQRLTAPPTTNAFERFQLALAIEPGNADAAQGIAQVAQAYLDLAQRKDPAPSLEQWLEYLTLAETVAAAHPAAQPQAAAARALREGLARSLVADGRKAVTEFRRDDALAAFAEALRVAPGFADAERGVLEARNVGTQGYVFRDPLRAGAAGPEMVVVARNFALGRHEVTRAEFAAYWKAAGEARFGGSPPSCRDRGAVFGGSRRRTWMAPDVAQNDRHPVVCVSYPMAEAYAAWLSEQTGRRYRLPSAAELSPFSGTPGNECTANLRGQTGCNDGFEGTAPVGSYAARGPGLFDTVGNVREWTSDCERGNCRDRVAVGGSWNAAPGEPMLKGFNADTAFNTVGFRLLRVID